MNFGFSSAGPLLDFGLWDKTQGRGIFASNFRSLFFVLTLELLNPLNLEPAFAQANFYQGKTLRVIVGYQPGDNHDQWARTYARFLGKQIPGNPADPR